MDREIRKIKKGVDKKMDTLLVADKKNDKIIDKAKKKMKKGC